MRQQNTKLITLITNFKSWIQAPLQTDTLISSARYVSLAESELGGRSRPPRQKFSVTSVALIFNQWGFNPPPLHKSNAAPHSRPHWLHSAE